MTPEEVWQLLPWPRRGTGTRSLPRTFAVSDLRRVARRRLPRVIFDYLEGGADQEVTLRDNVARFTRYRFHPRALTGVADPALRCSLFDGVLPLPVGLAPTGYTRLVHPAGELGVARAAGRRGVPYTAATMATTSIDELGRASIGPLWFQLYVNADWDVTEDLVVRAHTAGCQVLLVSVDTTVAGRRLRDLRHGLTIPPSLTLGALPGVTAHFPYWRGLLGGQPLRFANFPAAPGPRPGGIAEITSRFESALAWEHLDRLRRLWAGKLVLKGPLGPADVARAVASGCDGVYLSNHGGRQLDRTAHPLDLLAAARAAVGAGTTLLIDSGIRSGADVAVALAAGADFCLLGRPYLYGLAAGGEVGVELVINIVEEELRRTLQLLGVGSVEELREVGPTVVRAQIGWPDA